MIWNVAERKYNDLIKQLLFNRGVLVDDEKEVKKYLKPDFEKDLLNPFLMKGVRKAVDRIKKAKESNEKIGIYADYDADGIPGAALLLKALKAIGVDTEIYIPNREAGYGLSKEGIDFLLSEKCRLIITVDLGIRNFNEALYCKEKKIDLIITDHHLPDEKIPSADIVINPKIKGNSYPFKDLCGCGVAFKLVQALGTIYPREINEKFLKWNLDLVAISTIADVVPLVGENRVLAKYGLIVLSKTKNIGLQELFKIANIKPGSMRAYEVGFVIAPRINAPGRIDHATKSFELLITDNPKEAKELASWLEEKNQIRQEGMAEAEKEIINLIETEKMAKQKLLVLYGDWIKGILGPTASRITEKYYRPTILFSDTGDQLVGSARSVSDVNIVDLLSGAKEYIHKFGGHAGAAGVTVLKNSYSKFLQKITQLAQEKIEDAFLEKKIKVDAEVEPTEISLNFTKLLDKLEPFGLGNSKPVFLSSGVRISYPKQVGEKRNHLSCQVVGDDGNPVKSIFFNCERLLPLDHHKKYDIVFSAMRDEWQGRESVKFNLIDLRAHEE